MQKIIKFFDKFEDRVRAFLSHKPIFYAFFGGVGMVLFWKGVWETAEFFPILDGVGSIIVSVLILLTTGLFVSAFIGDSILVAGLKSQKKIAEKTEEDLAHEETDIVRIHKKIQQIDSDIKEIKELIKEKHGTGGKKTK